MKSALLRWMLRIVPFVLVLGFSLAAFQSGVDLSERPGLPQADWPTRIYYAIGLFVLGGLDLGVPIGGPDWARTGLWICYFVAPLAATTVVAEGLIRAIQPQWWVRSRRRDHIIVVGLGRFGLLLVEAIRLREPKRRIVAVERDGRKASVAEARERLGVEVFVGDINHRAAREELCLNRARGIALMTDNDLVNLEAAWDLTGDRPGLPAVVHVSDIGTLRKVEGLVSPKGLYFFNSHRLAAAYLFEAVLSERFASTPELDVVVIGGFGRFGQTILEHLQESSGSELRKVLLVDQDAVRKAAVFGDEVGFEPGIEWECICADLSDPRTWTAVETSMAGFDGVLSFVLGTDDDALNLRMAMSLRERYLDATIIVRCFHRSQFNEDLARSLNLTLMSMEDLVREAVDDQLLPHLTIRPDRAH
jgi:Trk K+ transport system NAD-binding subunit